MFEFWHSSKSVSLQADSETFSQAAESVNERKDSSMFHYIFFGFKHQFTNSKHPQLPTLWQQCALFLAV